MFQPPVIVNVRTKLDTHRNVRIFYPVLHVPANPQAEIVMNQTIITHLQQLLNERNIHDPSLVELLSWFEIKTNERGIFSLALYAYSYTGGAHGMTTIRTLTFAVETGRVFSLEELFRPESDYEDVLLSKIKEQIRERNIPVIVESATFPRDDNFYIADKSLVLYYQIYELAPYYYGITYFPVSVYALEEIIDEAGPLGKMMGSF